MSEEIKKTAPKKTAKKTAAKKTTTKKTVVKKATKKKASKKKAPAKLVVIKGAVEDNVAPVTDEAPAAAALVMVTDTDKVEEKPNQNNGITLVTLDDGTDKEEAPVVVVETPAAAVTVAPHRPRPVRARKATVLKVNTVVAPKVPEFIPSNVPKLVDMLAKHKAFMSHRLSNRDIKNGALALAYIAIEVHNNPTAKNLELYLDYLTKNPTILGNIQFAMDNVIKNGTRQRNSVSLTHTAMCKIARSNRSGLSVSINMNPLKEECEHKEIINFIASKIY